MIGPVHTDNDTASAPAPTWAVTMFSFTNELHEGSRSPDELLGEVVGAGLTTAIEVDAAQHFPSFPRISDNDIAGFRRRVDSMGVSPTMMGAYLDARLDARGPRTPDEAAEFLSAQLVAAAEMGFFGVRVGVGAVSPELAERLLPDLERLGIQILEEVQAGALPDSPAIERSLQLRERLGTDRLGFVFDSSLVMAGLPHTWVAALIGSGVPEPVIAEVDNLWRSHDPAGYQRMRELIAPLDLPAPAVRRLEMPFRRFGCTTVSDWADLLGQTTSVHLKYWDLDDTDGIVSGPTGQIKRALAAVGYSGFVCSEWGGHDWLETDTSSAFEMTARHRALFDAA